MRLENSGSKQNGKLNTGPQDVSGTRRHYFKIN
jgi:hypothetical protein